MCIGQVRVVFSVPENVIEHLFQNMHPPKYLAYIEWFSAFTKTREPNSKMYRIKRAVHNNAPVVSIIPVYLIKRSVHLIPKWGYQVPVEWTSDNVLELCSSSFLNSFKDRNTYFNVF